MSTVSSKVSFALIRRKQVEQLIGLKKAAIYLLVKQGKFPPPVRISKRAVAWRITDIDSWVSNLETVLLAKVGGEQ